MATPSLVHSHKEEHMPVVAPTDPVSPVDEYTIVHTGLRNNIKKALAVDDQGPLIDTTAALTLNSKKTKRLQKQQMKKKQKSMVWSETKSFLELPSELLHEVLSYLKPSDVLRLLALNRATQQFILENEASIARSIIQRRYWILTRCFPLPVPFEDVEDDMRAALLNPRRQEMLNIHKKPYQHIRPMDPTKICSCTACIFAWNNLCLVLDFAHWQQDLDIHQPIEMIARGTNPEWNRTLTETNARKVEKAMQSPLSYAAILQKHLHTTVRTLTRQFRVRAPMRNPDGSLHLKSRPKTVHPKRLYHLSEKDAETGTDEFLDRSGPPSYEFPFHRDNYYMLQAYLPNRKWSTVEQRWMYYAGAQHEKDLAWARAWFPPTPAKLEQGGNDTTNFKPSSTSYKPRLDTPKNDASYEPTFNSG